MNSSETLSREKETISFGFWYNGVDDMKHYINGTPAEGTKIGDRNFSYINNETGKEEILKEEEGAFWCEAEQDDYEKHKAAFAA